MRNRFAVLAVCTTILLGSISPSHAQQEIYPSLAQKMGIAGSVKVEVLVAPNGSAKSTQVLGGHPVLAQAGVEAIRYFKWEPATHETKEFVIFNFHPN